MGFQRKVGLCAEVVVGFGIVQGQQYWVTISAYPHKAEITLKWYQQYQNSNPTSTDVENGKEINWIHGEIINPLTFYLLPFG